MVVSGRRKRKIVQEVTAHTVFTHHNHLQEDNDEVDDDHKLVRLLFGYTNSNPYGR